MIIAIQAGGRSTRMKTDKAWLTIHGQPMIEQVIKTAQQITNNILIIINENSSHQTEYQNLANQYHSKLLPDAHDFRGPLGGIATALQEAMIEDLVLILACDLPFISAQFLQFLISIHQSNEALLTVPLDEAGRSQMLCAIYSPKCLHEIHQMLRADELKTRLLRDRVSTNIVSFESYSHLEGAQQFLTNINTPEEYQAFDSTA